MAIGSQCTRETPSLSGQTTGSLIVIVVIIIIIVIVIIIIVIVINTNSGAMSQHRISCLENITISAHRIRISPVAKTVISISIKSFSPCDKTDDTINLEHVRLALYAISTVALVPAIVIFHIYR